MLLKNYNNSFSFINLLRFTSSFPNSTSLLFNKDPSTSFIIILSFSSVFIFSNPTKNSFLITDLTLSG